MRVLDGLDKIEQAFARCVLTVGNFDGVHRAHRELLVQSRRLAANGGEPVVVLTFEPHPLCVVAPDRPPPPRITPPMEKLRLLERAGADVVVVAKSEPSLLGLEAERFVETVIHDLFHPTHVVEGPSFGFGRGRRGSPALLSDLAPGLGFQVHILEPVFVPIDGAERMVSSSLVRTLLSAGKLGQAALCLGRNHAMVGRVVRGVGRGRKLGFPTANLALSDQLIPADGVYAGMADVAGACHSAAISIGTTPTFDGQDRRVEVHLIDYAGDLYGQKLRLEVSRSIRPQRKFDSPDELIQQLHRDVASVRQLSGSDLRDR